MPLWQCKALQGILESDIKAHVHGYIKYDINNLQPDSFIVATKISLLLCPTIIKFRQFLALPNKTSWHDPGLVTKQVI